MINSLNEHNALYPNIIFGTDKFLQDLTNEILNINKSNLVALSCVNKYLASQTRKYAETKTPEGCFGKKEWLHYGVDPGVVFPISLKIIQDFELSKWMLTFIPEKINGEPLNLKTIDQFVSHCKKSQIALACVSQSLNNLTSAYFFHNDKKKNERIYEAPLFPQDIWNEILSRLVPNKNVFISNYRNSLGCYNIGVDTPKRFDARWVMLSKDVLGGKDLNNGTRLKSFAVQEELVRKAGYQIPSVIDAVVSLFMHNLKTGDFIYPNQSTFHYRTYTHLQEQNHQGQRLVVGSFFKGSLTVATNVCNDEEMAAACAKTSFQY